MTFEQGRRARASPEGYTLGGRKMKKKKRIVVTSNNEEKKSVRLNRGEGNATTLRPRHLPILERYKSLAKGDGPSGAGESW